MASVQLSTTVQQVITIKAITPVSPVQQIVLIAQHSLERAKVAKLATLWWMGFVLRLDFYKKTPNAPLTVNSVMKYLDSVSSALKIHYLVS